MKFTRRCSEILLLFLAFSHLFLSRSILFLNNKEHRVSSQPNHNSKNVYGKNLLQSPLSSPSNSHLNQVKHLLKHSKSQKKSRKLVLIKSRKKRFPGLSNENGQNDKNDQSDENDGKSEEKKKDKLFGEKPSLQWRDKCVVQCELCKGEVCGDLCCSVGKCVNNDCAYDFAYVVEGCNEHKNGRMICKIGEPDSKKTKKKLDMHDREEKNEAQKMREQAEEQEASDQNCKADSTDFDSESEEMDPSEQQAQLAASQGQNIGYMRGMQQGMMMASMNAQRQMAMSNMMTNHYLGNLGVQYGMAMVAQDEQKNNPDVRLMDRANSLHEELSVNAPEKDKGSPVEKKKGRRKVKSDSSRKRKKIQ